MDKPKGVYIGDITIEDLRELHEYMYHLEQHNIELEQRILDLIEKET
jgi:hypothetical protein